MTLEDPKREVVGLTEEERLHLTAFLRHFARADSPANKAELSRLNRSIDAGDFVTMEQWREAHAALEAAGY